MTVTVIGTGLIGGSMALAIKEKGLATRIIGADANPDHLQKALTLGLVDEVMDWEHAVDQSDLIIMAIPVNAVEKIVAVSMSTARARIFLRYALKASSHSHTRRFVVYTVPVQ